MRYRITISEIEHDGDERDAVQSLHDVGATNIKVVDSPYHDDDGDECAVFEFDHPATSMKDLLPLLEKAEICL